MIVFTTATIGDNEYFGLLEEYSSYDNLDYNFNIDRYVGKTINCFDNNKKLIDRITINVYDYTKNLLCIYNIDLNLYYTITLNKRCINSNFNGVTYYMDRYGIIHKYDFDNKIYDKTIITINADGTYNKKLILPSINYKDK